MKEDETHTAMLHMLEGRWGALPGDEGAKG